MHHVCCQHWQARGNPHENSELMSWQTSTLIQCREVPPELVPYKLRHMKVLAYRRSRIQATFLDVEADAQALCTFSPLLLYDIRVRHLYILVSSQSLWEFSSRHAKR